MNVTGEVHNRRRGAGPGNTNEIKERKTKRTERLQPSCRRDAEPN